MKIHAAFLIATFGLASITIAAAGLPKAPQIESTTRSIAHKTKTTTKSVAHKTKTTTKKATHKTKTTTKRR